MPCYENDDQEDYDNHIDHPHCNTTPHSSPIHIVHMSLFLKCMYKTELVNYKCTRKSQTHTRFVDEGGQHPLLYASVIKECK